MNVQTLNVFMSWDDAKTNLHNNLSPDKDLQVFLIFWFNSSVTVHHRSNATHSNQEAGTGLKEPTTCRSS